MNLYQLIKTYPHTIDPHHIVPPQQPYLTFNNLGIRVLAESQGVGHNGGDNLVGLDTSSAGADIPNTPWWLSVVVINSAVIRTLSTGTV